MNQECRECGVSLRSVGKESTPSRRERVKKTRPATEEERRRLCVGRVSARKVERIRRREHTFETVYVPTIGGIKVRTHSGLFFARRESAIRAGLRAKKALQAILASGNETTSDREVQAVRARVVKR